MNSSSNLSLRERREAIVREHIAAENAHDISRAIATFHHPRYEVAPFGSVNDGAQAVHDLLQGCLLAFLTFMSTCRECTMRMRPWWSNS
jgi:hypothetical protein